MMMIMVTMITAAGVFLCTLCNTFILIVVLLVDRQRWSAGLEASSGIEILCRSFTAECPWVLTSAREGTGKKQGWKREKLGWASISKKALADQRGPLSRDGPSEVF